MFRPPSVRRLLRAAAAALALPPLLGARRAAAAWCLQCHRRSALALPLGARRAVAARRLRCLFRAAFVLQLPLGACRATAAARRLPCRCRSALVLLLLLLLSARRAAAARRSSLTVNLQAPNTTAALHTHTQHSLSPKQAATAPWGATIDRDISLKCTGKSEGTSRRQARCHGPHLPAGEAPAPGVFQGGYANIMRLC